jgi:uncharacterized damage-inducible protein DinB
MDVEFLSKLFEHNNWANEQIIQVCAGLSDAQLDAQPVTATKGTIRETLIHLVSSQHGYLSLLTLPAEARVRIRPGVAEAREAARISGEGLLAYMKAKAGEGELARLRTTDGYWVEPWVVVLQALNHATEHREQIKSMLSALGITPPDVDGWNYGEATGTLEPLKG